MFGSVRALTLDLDDTLWDCERVILRAEQRLYDWLEAHFPRVVAEHTPESMRAVRARIGADHPGLRHDLSQLRRIALRWHAEQAGYAPEAVAEGFEVFFAARNDVELYADVLPALRELAGRFPLIALTNGNADLARIGIDHLFHANVSAAAVRASKPHPLMFESAAREAGVDPEQLLHVGDDPVTDIAGARNAGVRAVWINRKRAPWPGDLDPPEREIGELGELIGLLDGATGPPTA